MQDSRVTKIYKEVWNDFYTNKLDLLLNYVDGYAKILEPSVEQNSRIWANTKDFESRVRSLRNWLKNRAEYIQTQAVRKTSANSFLPNSLNSNVAEFITNYMKKNNLEYKPDFRHRTVCSVRGALAKAGIQYSDQDLLDYGFEEKYVSNTANLSFDALAE